MSMIDMNHFPYLERMKEAPEETGERLEIALSYIDFVIKILLKYCPRMTPKKTRSLLMSGQDNWKQLVAKGLVVQHDPDDGEPQYLDTINFPEMFISRVLGSATNDEEYETLLSISKNVCEFLGWGNLNVIEEAE